MGSGNTGKKKKSENIQVRVNMEEKNEIIASISLRECREENLGH